MNDFSDIENQLKKLRPLPASANLFRRIEHALAGQENRAAFAAAGGKSIWSWLRHFTETPYKIGFGLAAAAAAILVLAQVNLKSNKPAGKIAETTSPTLAAPATTPEFIPADFTRVVYHTSNDGLYFPSGSDRPVRRLQAHARETFEWRNPRTGASLRVSYPSDEVSLVPVSGQ